VFPHLHIWDPLVRSNDSARCVQTFMDRSGIIGCTVKLNYRSLAKGEIDKTLSNGINRSGGGVERWERLDNLI
jgi:hypothetical protein